MSSCRRDHRFRMRCSSNLCHQAVANELQNENSLWTRYGTWLFVSEGEQEMVWYTNNI